VPTDVRPRKEIAVLNRLNGSLEQSLREFESLLEVLPQYTVARAEYASALFDSGRTEDALAEMRRSIELDEPGRAGSERIQGLMLLERGSCVEAARILHSSHPGSENSVLPLFMQGVRLQDYLDLRTTSACVEELVTRDPSNAETQCQLGAILDASGSYAAALVAFRTGHAQGAALQAWRYPSSRWLLAAEQRAALEPRLIALLGTRESPRPTEDVLELSRMAARKGRPELAARWLTELFEREPGRAAEPDARLEAACAAVRAGEQEPALAVEPVRWRTLARGWLRDELERRTAEVRDDATALAARRALGAWQVASELAGVRDAERLERLPAAEREEWSALWSSASALSDEARRRTAGIPRAR
jgi:tetratricopeptide (TPR) repeat protein